MKKAIIILVICIVFVLTIQAQQQLPAFGKVDMSELEMKECAFEKEAPAMKLIDEVTAVVDVDDYSGDVNIRYERRVRIKIFSDRGFESGSISIPYYGNNSITKITNLDAAIYNIGADGKIEIHELNKDEIFKDKGGGKKGVNSIKFTFPGLKAGSVIEYRYTKIRKHSSHLEPWFFQDEIPVQVSSCTINAPRLSILKTHFVTALPVDEDSIAEKQYEDKIMLRRYALHDVPSFRFEPMMSAIKDNLQRVEFAINPKRSFGMMISFDAMTAWSFYNSSLILSPFFGGQLAKTVDGTQNIIDSVKHLEKNADKINAVYEYVKKNIQWDKEQTYYADDINEAWKNKKGNSAEINLTIINLLLKTGVDCSPILISTRENGKADKNFPNMGQFNGVDVLVTDSIANYVLDGTEEYQNYQTPPFNILNRECLLIDKKDYKWITVSDERKLMNTFVSANATVDSNGVLNGEAAIIFKDYAKAGQLKKEKDDKDDEDAKQERDKNFLQSDQPDFKIDSAKNEDANDVLKPLTHKLWFHYTLSSTGDIYFINPYFLSMFRKNPFVDSVRHTDIDFGCNQYYANSIYINIPKNFSVEEVPKSIVIRTEDSAIIYNRQFYVTENAVVIRSSFELNYAQFGKENYPALKTFFEKVYALANQQIVLKKKE